jgi:hypothetical protein
MGSGGGVSSVSSASPLIFQKGGQEEKAGRISFSPKLWKKISERRRLSAERRAVEEDQEEIIWKYKSVES